MKAALAIFLGVMILVAPVRATAQDDQTLADIRQELSVLFVEIQRLKRELSTTGSPGVSVGGQTVLDRVNAMESELQRLTAQTEELEFRIDRIVRDGTNRIGDLEFRLVELEGGDVSQLGETSTLGGGALPSVPAVQPDQPAAPDTSQLAVGEAADYKAALAAIEAGDFAQAVTLLNGFNQNYPGSPLAADAALRRGLALNQLGDTREAARAFLESYSTDPEGAVAPQAVLELGTALGTLGKTREACVTLGEIGTRYPTSNVVDAARDTMTSLGCG
jgi:tol-pal system protein YbgF